MAEKYDRSYELRLGIGEELYYIKDLMYFPPSLPIQISYHKIIFKKY